jgi:hypothetical protein
MHTWKCHNEIPCIAALNKQKCHFKKWRTGRQNRSFWGVGTGGKREDIGKEDRSVNVVGVLYIDVCK